MLLVIGAVSVLVSDNLQPLWPSRLSGSGFVVLYLAWGAAALHPSMVGLTTPAAPRASPRLGRWAMLLGISVSTPPVVLLLEAVNGPVADGVVIAAAGAVTLLLAITRLTDVVTLNGQALTRERCLRQANAALVAAADTVAVSEAVRAAVARIMPPKAIRSTEFAIDEHQLTTEVTGGPGAGLEHRSWWVGEADPHHATLVCPLRLERLAVARPQGGALIVAGRRDALTASRSSLEMLAGQAALALDRIFLMDAVGRRDSDFYLRAVIPNNVDMMMVVLDEDHRIRYASPSLRELLGFGELPPLAGFDDLLHPDYRSEFQQALRSCGDGVVFCSLLRADGSEAPVEAAYRDLREDRLVQGFVVTMRSVRRGHEPDQRPFPNGDPHGFPVWSNRRSGRHKFRY